MNCANERKTSGVLSLKIAALPILLLVLKIFSELDIVQVLTKFKNSAAGISSGK